MSSNKLVDKSVKGMMWSYISTFTNAFCNIAFAAVMARLLAPAAFGLFAMAQVVLRFGQYFAQMGLGSALVQKAELTKRDIRTSLSLMFGMSGLVYGGLWLISPLAALYFQDTEVIPIIRVAGLSLVIQAIAAIPLSLLRRDMNFRRYSIIEISSYILGYGFVGILCAWNNMGVWALVFAQIGQSFVQLFLAWWLVKLPYMPGWDAMSAKRLISFGGKVSIISFLEFISSNLDTILMGRFFSSSMLGYYNRGKMLPHLPLYYTSVSLNRVLFPLFSQLNEDKKRQLEIFRKGLFLLSTILIPAAAALSIFSPLVVYVLLGQAWQQSVPVVTICAYAVLFDLLSSPLAILCEARALLNRKIFVQVVRIGSLLISFWLLKDHGLNGMAFAYLLSQILGFTAYLALVRSQIGSTFILSTMLPGFVIAVAASIGGLVPLLFNLTQYNTWGLQIVGFFLFAFVSLCSKPMKKYRNEALSLLVNIKQKITSKALT